MLCIRSWENIKLILDSELLLHLELLFIGMSLIDAETA